MLLLSFSAAVSRRSRSVAAAGISAAVVAAAGICAAVIAAAGVCTAVIAAGICVAVIAAGICVAVVAAGMADYSPGKAQALRAVFEQADARMYENKKELKALGVRTR